MSHRVAVLASASIAGLLAASNFAQAQQAGLGADATSTATPPVDEIVVTGVRTSLASLASAVNAKRLAPSNINVIAPEDLGRFHRFEHRRRAPARSRRRSPARQPWSGAGHEHLDPWPRRRLCLSTVNGREFFGNPVFGNFRVVDYDSIPSEVLTSTTVFKSPTADLIEPGMAGEIDLRTLRPLDYKNKNGHTDQFITGGFNAAYNSHTGIRATVDYAHSHSDYMFRQVGAGPQGVLPTDYIADLSGATPKITLLAPVNFADPTNYVFNGAGTNIGAPGYQQIGGAYIVRRKTGGTRDQVRVDFEFTPVDQYKIKVGARYSTLSFLDRNVFFNTAGPGNLNQPTGSLFNGTIQEAFFPAAPRATLGPILAANPKWSQFLYGSVPLLGGPLPLLQNATAARPPCRPRRAHGRVRAPM